jgi:hypothetical protein
MLRFAALLHTGVMQHSTIMHNECFDVATLCRQFASYILAAVLPISCAAQRSTIGVTDHIREEFSMTDHHDSAKRPHGETGDTVQQAADVSQPTKPSSNLNRVLGNNEAAQVPPESKTGTDTRESAGGGGNVGEPGGPDSGSDAMPGQSNAL